jgi:hypothetical protein
VDAGRRAAPAGPVTRIGHSGGVGAPPGTIKSPCQELADGLVCADRLLLKRVSALGGGQEVRSRQKARPGAGMRTPHALVALSLALLERSGAPRGARRVRQRIRTP